ncbi:sugar phosphate isomerase/epimerase [Victivallaceae bacterium BBE-744-WT-12]|jgi:sugar phosphate isomerase/epimerase|uniref:Sugar phosphate isomerase/epimerase n=1 Tax=Victivallis lenta TaxID=2606640 RepID=A0A844G2M8_9BACT|nr:sugar phosphate isomerase/epimerase family protein [Victivallis lenta]AVM47118.1 sugar phosphate isomerase/epimerase [Victivallales bacterium CCUG 44730]MBS1453763.1 sugar phosphate isomerase/epimerase [Lentisphaeria bacterium]MBS5531796.1 sugar phosphate isomerase/epimerase [bacterium]MST97980.1 sugar phosphate isomerase/epimerase [Victivallis lenta]HBP06583.1 sugar phosphate isomerase/epimerase [Lentisphaeria bacterium]
MYYTGFADEAARGITGQIEATKKLGWKWIESRAVDGVNIHDLPEEKFEAVAAELEASGVGINCFGSAVANWGWDPVKEEDFKATVEQLKRALVRMKRLNCKMIRGMSFRAQWNRPAWDAEIEAHVFRKVEFLVRMCEEAGVLYLHENCNNYGGMSWKHTLKLLDRIKSPNFKLVFDTGNPVLNFDRSEGDELSRVQSSWEFYSHVKEFIHYVHIKDAKFLGSNIESGFNKAEFTFPGEGEGDVVRIVTDLLKNGYDGGFSMEPHMKNVFHESVPEGQREQEKFDNYVEYGRRFMQLVDDVKKSLA